MATLHAAVDAGITFFDTADVYGDGLSERLIARLRRERTEPFFVATKAGRRLPAQTVAGYSPENLAAFVDRSLTNLGVERLDLLQLHCPPTDVYYRPEVFGFLDDLVAAGKVRFYGVSVERVEERSRRSNIRACRACRSSSTSSGCGRRNCSSNRPSAGTSP